MTGYDIVRFKEYRIRESELEHLDELKLSVLAVLSFAVSEMNALARIYITTMDAEGHGKAIEAGINIQKQTIMRTWSAKVFEALEFLEGLPQSGKNVDDDFLDFRRFAVSQIEELKSQPGFQILRALRHEAANHYSLKAARKSLKASNGSRDATFYLHELDGNSFFAYGEEVLFLQRLERLRVDLSIPDEDAGKLLDEWISWAIKVKHAVAQALLYFFDRFLWSKLDKKFQDQIYYVDKGLVAARGEISIPLLVRAR